MLRRLFSGTYRQARRAEARGLYRDAAVLYAEAGADRQAARALAHEAERSAVFAEAVTLYRDALRWATPGDPLRPKLLGQLGRRILSHASRHGVSSEADRRQLLEAAEALSSVGRWTEAADAYEMLGELDRTARCLEKAGEVERLEKLLAAQGAAGDHERVLDRCLDGYRMAMATGDRVEAAEQMAGALRQAPDDPLVAEMSRDFNARRLAPGSVRVRTPGGETLLCLGRLPIEVGREADVPLRGASVSRRHARLSRRGAQLVVEDLGSRNGTLLGGVPIAGELAVEPPTQVGLGDDVALDCGLYGETGLRITVRRGLDRALEVLASEGEIDLPGTAARLSFPGGWPTLGLGSSVPGVLGGIRCVAPVSLLVGDRIELEGGIFEVVA